MSAQQRLNFHPRPPRPAPPEVRRLKLVDPDSGRLYEGPDDHQQLLLLLAKKEDAIAGLQRDIRGWSHRFYELKRDRDAEARDHQTWPMAHAAFDYWREKCDHKRVKFSTDLFEMIRPFLRDYGLELVLRAIAGAAFDPFITTRKNGSKKKHDGLDLVFRNTVKFTEFANRAPKDWTAPPDLLARFADA